MAQQGHTEQIGQTATEDAKKDFQGSGVEGQKDGEKTLSDEDRAEATRLAIGQLDREKDFTAGGKPNVKALEEILGFDISAAERDAAWAEVEDKEQSDVPVENPPPAKEKTVITCDDVLRSMRAKGMKV